MIEVKQLSKSYGERQAISNLSFNISRGDVVGFLGPNGAGKSTTMKIITGFMAPTSGEAKVCGFDVFENPIEVKKRIGYLPETPPLYSDMLVKDFLKYVAELKGVSGNRVQSLVEKSLKKTQLIDVQSRLIKNLSKGFKQRVGIAQALVSDPEVLVLDEPTVGLDPKQVAEIRELITEIRGDHTVILSTHILPEVQATCNKVIIIHEGKIVAQDSIEEIEKMNQGKIVLRIKTLKSSSIIDNIKAIEEVESVKLSSERVYEISIKAPEGQSEGVIERVSSEVFKSGAGLLELSISKANLEDVFLKLTYGQSSVQEAVL